LTRGTGWCVLAAMAQYTTAPEIDDIAELAERALAAIPARLRRQVAGVNIAVEELADDATLAEMEIENPWELSGLYRGTPLQYRDSGDVAPMPNQISLYRLPILLEWVEEGEDLYRLVRNVLVHEIAHHFGFSDAEIEALENEME
jgi:predicted Zn-dependent protease with MMP-like domain